MTTLGQGASIEEIVPPQNQSNLNTGIDDAEIGMAPYAPGGCHACGLKSVHPLRCKGLARQSQALSLFDGRRP